LFGLILHLQTSRLTYFHAADKLNLSFTEIYITAYQIHIHPVLKVGGII